MSKEHLELEEGAFASLMASIVNLIHATIHEEAEKRSVIEISNKLYLQSKTRSKWKKFQKCILNMHRSLREHVHGVDVNFPFRHFDSITRPRGFRAGKRHKKVR